MRGMRGQLFYQNAASKFLVITRKRCIYSLWVSMNSYRRFLGKFPCLIFRKCSLYVLLSYPELLNILDFLRIMPNIQTVSQSEVEKSKRKVIEIVNLYIENIDGNVVNELLILYCKLTTLSSDDRLGKMFLKSLWQIREELPFTVYENYIVVKSLSRKEMWSNTDKDIFAIFIQDTHKKIHHMDHNLTFKFAKTLFDFNVCSLIAKSSTLSIV